MPVTFYQSAAFYLAYSIADLQVTLPSAELTTRRATLDLRRLRLFSRLLPRDRALLDAVFAADAGQDYADPERYAELWRVLEVLLWHRRIAAAREALKTWQAAPIESWLIQAIDAHNARRLGGRLDPLRGAARSCGASVSGEQLARQEWILDRFIQFYHSDDLADTTLKCLEYRDGATGEVLGVIEPVPYTIVDREGVIRALVEYEMEDSVDLVTDLGDRGALDEFADEHDEMLIEIDEELMREVLGDTYEGKPMWYMLGFAEDWGLVEPWLAQGLIRPRATEAGTSPPLIRWIRPEATPPV